MVNDRLQHALDWCIQRKAARDSAGEKLLGSNSFSAGRRHRGSMCGNALRLYVPYLVKVG